MKPVLKSTFVSGIIILLLISPEIISQSIVRTDLLWSSVGSYILGDNKYHTSGTKFDRFEGDTLIGESIYTKVWSSFDSLQSWIWYGCIRETAGKTYYRGLGRDYDRLLYDFNRMVGDTILIWTYEDPQSFDSVIVTQRDSANILGRNRLRLQVAQLNKEYVKDTWIEGIGSLNGILLSFYTGSGKWTLLCQFENDNLIYHNENYSKCYFPKDFILQDKAINGLKPTFFPNPVSNILHIKFPEPINSIQICDMSGRIILTKSFLPNIQLYDIDVSALPKGCYIISIQLADLRRFSQLILK